MNYGVDFEYAGSFHLSKCEIDEILDNVQNGFTIEEAVEDWSAGLDDFDYYIVSEHIKGQIIKYIEQIVEDA